MIRSSEILAAAILVISASAAASAQDVVSLVVMVSRYRFDPGGPDVAPIHLQAGTNYEITFHSTDVEHGLSAIPALGISESLLAPDFDAVIQVAPTLAQVGRYNFACTRVCGAGHGGMYGAIQVDGVDPAHTLPLEKGRFQVGATFRMPGGTLGTATPVALTSDSGYFWFFDPDNVELVVKVLDGCGIDGAHWVFASGLSNLEVSLRVDDLSSGNFQLYTNSAGLPFPSIQDTGAFACP